MTNALNGKELRDLNEKLNEALAIITKASCG